MRNKLLADKAEPQVKAAVLGSDVSQSRSPPIHRAAFEALRIHGRYDAFSIEGRAFAATVRTLAQAGYRYLNVTIPHKRRAAAIATRKSAAVAATGAANTLVIRRRRDGRLQISGDNTDGHGLLAALADAGVRVRRNTRVVMIGSGGAAAGTLPALCRAGAHVTLLARRKEAARRLVRGLPVSLRRRAQADAWSPESLAAALPAADVLVSAVPAAAWAGDARAGLAGLSRRAVVVEMAYGKTTPLARAVRNKARFYQDGLPMLVHQAARSIVVALGKAPPIAPLFTAVGRTWTPRR